MFSIRSISTAALSAIAIAAAPAAAQTTHIVGTYGRVESGSYPYACAPANPNARVFDVTCTGPTATGHITARVDERNNLHASSDVWATDANFADGYSAVAEAFFFDQIVFTGNAPTQLVLNVAVHGNVAGDGHATTGGLLGYGDGAEPVYGLGIVNDGTWNQSFGTFIVPVVNNVATFGLKLWTNAYIWPAAPGECTGISCTHGIADFSHTAYVNGLIGLDDNGDAVTGLTARTASGVSYDLAGGVITTATPEPATLSLLGLGVGMLGLALKRRRLV